MQLVTYQSATGPRAAARRDAMLVDLNEADPSVPCCLKALLAEGPAGLQRARAALDAGRPFPAEGVQLLPPILRPEKIICAGLNYRDHAMELGIDLPKEPAIFAKFITALAGPDDAIVLPRLSRQVDYEAELVIVIGADGRDIPIDRARDHIAGYCCGNDVSARDWQFGKPGGQWLLGKTFDGFAPIGPALVTADEVPEPNHLAVRLRVNGQTMQQSNTDQFLFPVEQLVSYISGICTLTPGDLIFTGTPPGVGMARKPPVFLQPGDIVEVDIERVGVLRNTMVAEA